jgi:hypothetical protein
LNLLFGEGATTPSQTGLHIASDGQITFASGQTFPGTGTGDGTITGITTASGSGLAGGGSSGTLSLSVPAAGINNAMLQNSKITLNAGTGLTAPGAMSLGHTYTVGINTSVVPQLAAANTFTANQTVNGSVSATAVNGSSSTVGMSGVYGNNSATSGGGTNGVYGSTSSPAGAGTVGVNFSSGGSGLYGQGNGTASGSTGVYGNATGNSLLVGQPTYGVYGVTSNTYGGGSAGVYGYASSPIFEPVNNQRIYGVYGAADSAADYSTGVGGTGPTISLTGSGYSGLTAGVWGDGGPTSSSVMQGIGIFGTADDYNAVVGVNSSGTDVSEGGATIIAQNNSTTTGALILYTVGGTGEAPFGECTINVNGDLSCTGTVTPAVPVAGGREVKLYGVAATENWFEDFGSGQLSGGSTLIPLDPTFASTVNTGESYHVFLTPNGDCKGLYVARKTASGFEVRELGGGASSIFFDYRIVAKRRGYESSRMEDITDQMEKMRQGQAALRAKTARGGVMKSAPPHPLAPELTPRVPQQAQPARVSSLKTTPAFPQ